MELRRRVRRAGDIRRSRGCRCGGHGWSCAPGTLDAAGAAGAAGIQEKEETISCLLFSVNPKTNLTYEKNSNYVITIIVP